MLLRQGTIDELVYDDAERNFANNFSRLKACGALSWMKGPPAPDFFWKIMLATCKSARLALENGQQPDETVKEALQTYNFPINAQSLLSLEETGRDAEIIYEKQFSSRVVS